MEPQILQYHRFSTHDGNFNSTDLLNRNFQYEAGYSPSENCIGYIIEEQARFTMGFSQPNGCYNLSTPKEPYLLGFFRTMQHHERVFELHVLGDLDLYLLPSIIVEFSSLSGTFPPNAIPYLHRHKGKLELVIISRQSVPENHREKPIIAESVSFQLMEYRDRAGGGFPTDFYTHLN